MHTTYSSQRTIGYRTWVLVGEVWGSRFVSYAYRHVYSRDVNEDPAALLVQVSHLLDFQLGDSSLQSIIAGRQSGYVVSVFPSAAAPSSCGSERGLVGKRQLKIRRLPYYVCPIIGCKHAVNGGLLESFGC